jgi:uncharacterized protein
VEQPLDDTELEELHQILIGRGDGEGLALDGVQGLITAVIIGPNPPAAQEWVPRIIDDGRPFVSIEQAERAVQLLLRLHQMVADALEQFTFEPILGQVENEAGEMVMSAQGWCEGFSQGVDLRGELWQSRIADDPRLLEALGPIVQLAADEGVFDQGDGEDVVPLSEAEYEQALSGLAAAVADVQQYWREQASDAASDDAQPRPARPRRRGGPSIH